MRPGECVDRPLSVGALLRGDKEALERAVLGSSSRVPWSQLAIIVIGAGAFGAAAGSWRAPEQGLWSAIKLPCVLLLTAAGNALINGMLAPLLGVKIRMRQSLRAVLMSFGLVAIILGAFSPIVAFLVWNLPPPQHGMAGATTARNAMLLILVLAIAFAGIAANVRLLQFLQRLANERSAAVRLLIAWLSVNLLLGSQLSWVARPFIGEVDSPVTFFEPSPLRGSFFAEVAKAVRELASDARP